MSLPSPLLGAMDVRRVEIDARVGGRFTFSDMLALVGHDWVYTVVLLGINDVMGAVER